MLGEQGGRFREWVGEHPRSVGVFFLILAALNGWLSFLIFSQRPLVLNDLVRYVLALANATLAGILVLGVILTWK